MFCKRLFSIKWVIMTDYANIQNVTLLSRPKFVVVVLMAKTLDEPKIHLISAYYLRPNSHSSC